MMERKLYIRIELTESAKARAEAAGLGMKSWIAGNLTSAMTGAWIGLVSWGG